VSHGIDDFSVGERVLFVKQQVCDEDGKMVPAYGDGVVVSINRDLATIDLNVRTMIPGWFNRVTKRPWELEKLPAPSAQGTPSG
jgi:hypothetical protein